MTRTQILRYVAILALGALLAVTFVQLGRWQLDRLDQRRERNATVVAHENEPVRLYTEVMTGPIGEDQQWYRVTASGEYLPDVFQVRYRSLDGKYGSEVLGVLRTDQGDHIVVNRGFLQREAARPDTETIPNPAGPVTITAFVQQNHDGDEQAMTPHEGNLRLINSEVLGRHLGVELLDGFVTLIESTPADSAELTPLGTPPLDEGSHFSYALQWFAFTIIGVVGLVVLIRADLRDRKKAKARAERAASRGTRERGRVETADP